MADLANPTVAVTYACGCSFTDTTETGGTKTFRFGGDETRMFQLKQALETGGTKEQTDKLKADALNSIDDVKPTKGELDAKATPQDVYEALLERHADDVPDAVSDEGVRFPQPPPSCPRHGQPALHTHASYLNPSDVKPTEDPVFDAEPIDAKRET